MTKIITKDELKNRLNKIYKKIPEFKCKHCHKCEQDLIIWFKPEEINIRDYMSKHNIEYITLSSKEFKKNNKQCPYLKNNRCIIYPVRPIVCRLQGTISELPCKYNKNQYMSKKQFATIKKEFNQLLKDIDALGEFYGTLKP